MPVYKDKNNNTWYCKFYITDYLGNKKQKLKRGFKTKRQAKEYEINYLNKINVDLSMPLKNFIDIYMEDIKPKIKLNTYNVKKEIQKIIIKDLGNIPINKINNKIINVFFNDLISANFANSTIKGIKSQLSAIFNHATKYYNFTDNPLKDLGTIKNPNEKPKEYIIWSLDDYKKAIKNIDDIEIKTLINLLYWSGIRIGEALALSWYDIDFINKTVKINKTYKKIDKKGYITPTKTYNTRVILLPDTTIEQLKEYKQRLYNTSDRLFLFTYPRYIQKLKKIINDNELPTITLHGLRHSHASYLLSNGANISYISKRLGHKDITTTLNVYSHFLPDDELTVIQNINKLEL